MNRHLPEPPRRCPLCIEASKGDDMLMLADQNIHIETRHGRTFYYASGGNMSDEERDEMLELLATMPRHIITPEEDERLWLAFASTRTECQCGGTGYATTV